MAANKSKPKKQSTKINPYINFLKLIILAPPIAFLVLVAPDWNDPVRFISDSIGSVIGLVLVFIIYAVVALLLKYYPSLKKGNVYKKSSKYGGLVLVAVVIIPMFAFKAIDSSIINNAGITADATVNEVYYTTNERIAGLGSFISKTSPGLADTEIIKYTLKSTKQGGTIDMSYSSSTDKLNIMQGQTITIRYLKTFPYIANFVKTTN